MCYEYKIIRLKNTMDHATVLCCMNMSGSDKHKLLMFAKSHCFKWLRLDSLLVHYYFNKNNWMTSTIFQEWIVNWDTELQKNYSDYTRLCCTSTNRLFKKHQVFTT